MHGIVGWMVPPFTAVLHEFHNLHLDQNDMLILVGLQKEQLALKLNKYNTHIFFWSDKTSF